MNIEQIKELIIAAMQAGTTGNKIVMQSTLDFINKKLELSFSGNSKKEGE